MDKDKLRKIREIMDEILEKKILEKHQQYGESLENPINIFNGLMNPQLLIDVRVDDKLSRIQSLSNEDPKYWSEIKEIIAYLIWKIYLYEKDHPFHPNDVINDAEAFAKEWEFKRGEFDICRFCPYFQLAEDVHTDAYCIRHRYYISNDEEICDEAIKAREDFNNESCGCDCGCEGEPVESSGNTPEIFKHRIPDSTVWRLSSSGPYPLREKEL